MSFGNIRSLIPDCILCGSIEACQQITTENQMKWTEDFCKLFDIDITCTGLSPSPGSSSGYDSAVEVELIKFRRTIKNALYCVDCIAELQSISTFYKTIDDVNAQLKVIQLQCESKLKSCLEALKEPLETLKEIKVEVVVPETETEAEAEMGIGTTTEEGEREQHQEDYFQIYQRKQWLLDCMQKRHQSWPLADKVGTDIDMANTGLSGKDHRASRKNLPDQQPKIELNSYNETGETITPDFQFLPELTLFTYNDEDDSNEIPNDDNNLTNHVDHLDTYKYEDLTPTSPSRRLQRSFRGYRPKSQRTRKKSDGTEEGQGEGELTADARVVSGNPLRFPCTFEGCTESYPLEIHREEHIRRFHEGLKYPFQCETCRKPCYSYWKLQDHKNIHKGLTPYECPDSNCLKKFATRFMLTCHVRRKKLQKQKKRNSQPQLEPEPGPELDLDPNPYLSWLELTPNSFLKNNQSCPMIQTQCTENELIQKEEPEQGPNVIRKRKPRNDLNLPFQFRCMYPECMKQFRKESQLEGHVKVDHEKSIKFPFPCDVCSKRCYSYEKLLQHGNVHKGLTPFKCPDLDCGKCFATEQLLYFHTRRKKIKVKKRSGSNSNSRMKSRTKSVNSNQPSKKLLLKIEDNS